MLLTKIHCMTHYRVLHLPHLYRPSLVKNEHEKHPFWWMITKRNDERGISVKNVQENVQENVQDSSNFLFKVVDRLHHKYAWCNTHVRWRWQALHSQRITSLCFITKIALNFAQYLMDNFSPTIWATWQIADLTFDADHWFQYSCAILKWCLH